MVAQGSLVPLVEVRVLLGQRLFLTHFIMIKTVINLILSRPSARLPFYATPRSSGADLYAAIEEDMYIEPGERTLIPTGVKIELPEGYEAQVRPRSGLALREGVVAALGTIDGDYRGEVGVILFNLSNMTFRVHEGERIAQLVIIGDRGVVRAEWNRVNAFEEETERGEGGFGHTGK